MSNIVVSVICLAYNHERYIRDTLDGFLIQKTPFDVEFIVAEDCSTDNTINVINEYRDKFGGKLIVIQNDSNLGFMKNFINAMDSAKGKYIAICEGDDYWIDPEKLSIQVSRMEEFSDVNISFHSSMIKYGLGGRADSLWCRRGSSDCTFRIEDVIGSSGSFMPTAAIMIRSDAYRNLSSCIRNLYVSYTTAFLTQLIFSFPNGSLYIDRPMSVYRSMSVGSWTESVMSNTEKYLFWHNRYLNTVKSYDRLTNHEYKLQFRKAIAEKHLSIVKHEGITDQYKKEYFLKNKSDLFWWQILFWWGIYYFPWGTILFRQGKVKLSQLKVKLGLINGS